MAEQYPDYNDWFVIIYDRAADEIRFEDNGGWEHRNPSTFKLCESALEQIERPYAIDFKAVVHTNDHGPDKPTGGKAIDLTCVLDREGVVGPAIPDFVFDCWKEVGIIDYEQCRLAVTDQSTVCPEDPRLFWIGNPSTLSHRWALLDLAREHSDRIHAIGMDWDRHSLGPGKQQPVGGYVSLPEHCRFRYLIDIEGWGYSARLKILLHSGRPLFLQDRRYVEYWYEELVPFTHFIPVKNDLSDLIERLDWADAHPDECRVIAENAQQFALDHLSRESAVQYLAGVFQRLIESSAKPTRAPTPDRNGQSPLAGVQHRAVGHDQPVAPCGLRRPGTSDVTTLHLCIICGRDNRYPYLRHTVSHALPAFDGIHILDTGSTDRSRELASMSSRIDYRTWDRWERGWGDAYDCVRENVPSGHWFLYLDSDELPSAYLLQHIRESVSRIDREGYGQAMIPNVLHLDGHPTGASAEALPRTPEEYARNHCWTKTIISRNAPTLEARNFGVHAGYHNDSTRTAYLPLYYCHHKTRRQVDASISICSFLLLESYDVPADTAEHAVLTGLARRHRISRPDELIDLLQSDPPTHFLETLESWKDSDLRTCRHWYAWYRAGFAVGGEALQLCSESCCDYTGCEQAGIELEPGSIPVFRPGWQLEADDGSGGFRLVLEDCPPGIDCNESAVAIASRIDGASTVAEIAGDFAARFPESAGAISRDTVDTIRLLRDKKVVRLHSVFEDVPDHVREAIETSVAQRVAPWRTRSPWSTRRLREKSRERSFIVVRFDSGVASVSWNGHEGGRSAPLARYFQRIAMEYPQLRGDFAFDAQDSASPEAEFPLLGFAVRRSQPNPALLVPDLEFMNGYRTINSEIRDATRRIRWDDKLRLAIWRGSPTGQANNGDNWHRNLRVRICLLAKDHRFDIDAALSSCAQCDPAASDAITAAGLLGPRLPGHAQCNYRYIINADGNSSAWSATYWKLLSSSLMIHVGDAEAIGDGMAYSTYEQWYHPWLERDVHYLGCRVENLLETIEWARSNDGKAQEIAGNATHFVNQYLSQAAGRLYTARLLEELSRTCDHS